MLILDNYSAHRIFTAKPNNITIQFLPPNVTSTSQPLDQGIISSIKRNYRVDVLKQMIKGIDERLLSGNKVQNEYDITKNMKFPDILQAMLTLNSSWDRTTQQTIRNCWIHANLIPSSMVAALRNMAEIENEVGDDIEKICDLLSNYQLDHFQGEKTKTNKRNMLKNDIEEWIIIESNESVMMNVLDEQLWEENYLQHI